MCIDNMTQIVNSNLPKQTRFNVSKQLVRAKNRKNQLQMFHMVIRRGTIMKLLSKNTNVLKTGSVIEPEKLPIYGSLVGPMIEPRLNR